MNSKTYKKIVNSLENYKHNLKITNNFRSEYGEEKTEFLAPMAKYLEENISMLQDFIDKLNDVYLDNNPEKIKFVIQTGKHPKKFKG